MSVGITRTVATLHREHNAVEAMQEALEDLIEACQHKAVKASLDYYMEFAAKVVKAKTALALVKGD